MIHSSVLLALLLWIAVRGPVTLKYWHDLFYDWCVCVCVCVYIYGALVINSPGITNRRQLFSAPSQLPYLPCSDVINTSLISPWPMWLLMDRKFREFFIGLSLRRINPLNPELNPICYLLALLGAHHFLHVSRIRVKLLTLRRLMSYIYIWSTHSWCF